MKRLNGGNVPKIALTLEEWRLAAMPMPMMALFEGLEPEDHVPVPVKATENGIADALGFIERAATVYDAVSQDPSSTEELATDARRRFYAADTMAARIVRLSGFDIETYQDEGLLVKTDHNNSAA